MAGEPAGPTTAGVTAADRSIAFQCSTTARFSTTTWRSAASGSYRRLSRRWRGGYLRNQHPTWACRRNVFARSNPTGLRAARRPSSGAPVTETLKTLKMDIRLVGVIGAGAEFAPDGRNRMMEITYRFASFAELEKREELIILENDLTTIQPNPDYVEVQIDEPNR